MIGEQEVAEAQALEEVVAEEAAAAVTMMAVMVKSNNGSRSGTETILTLPMSCFATILPRSTDSSPNQKKQLKEWRMGEEHKKANQMKAIQVQISQLHAELSDAPAKASKLKSNRTNKALQGIKRNVPMEDSENDK